jgi:hypothetical protein
VTSFDSVSSRRLMQMPADWKAHLLNLAVNARDAMPKGWLSHHRPRDCANLTRAILPVQAGDLAAESYALCLGHGYRPWNVSRETLERALEPFFTTKARNKGTGLGLAMVYGFRQAVGWHRPHLQRAGHTEPPSRSICPWLRLLANRPVNVPDAETHGETTGGTVLVVDDEADLLEIANAYLDGDGLLTA